MRPRPSNWEKRARRNTSALRTWNRTWQKSCTTWLCADTISFLPSTFTDFRLDTDGNPRLIVINPLPGLTSGYSDLCIQAAAEGIRYEDLILEILYLAAGRWGLLEPRDLPPEQPKKKK